MHQRVAKGLSSSFSRALFFLICLFAAATLTYADSLDEWQVRGSGTTSDLYNVAWGGGRFVVVGTSGSILTSSSGADWSGTSFPGGVWLYGAAAGNGVFVAAGQAGTVISSTNGTSWSQRSSGTTNMLYCATFGGGRFVIVGMGGTILTSTDGSDWTQVASGVSLGLFGVVYGNGLFVIVGESGIVMTSPDGLNWTRRTSNTTRWLDEVTFGNNRFVAAGEEGTVITSSDGAGWTVRSSGTPTTDFYCIGFGNGTFAAVGSQGTIITSSDGITWVQRPSGTTTSLRGIAFDGRRFVATGFGGTILQSGAVSGPPVADAGARQVVEVGTLVRLDGSNSYDPMGGGLAYQWAIDSAPRGSAAVLSNPGSVSPSFIPDVVGMYGLRLVVRNESGDPSDPAFTEVTAGTPPVADAGKDQSGLRLGATVVLDGSASTAPDGNLPLGFFWEITARPSNSAVALVDPWSMHPSFTPDVRGIYTLRLVVTNSIGLSSQPDTVTITVGIPPVARPGSNRTVMMGTKVTLDASASSSPDGATPLTFTWELQARPGGSAASLENMTTAQPTFTADIPGNFTVNLTVMDPAGFQSPPTSVTVVSMDPDSGGGGGTCFIATAAYGSPLAPQVVVLRQFRDRFLLRFAAGRYFVHMYYSFSPALATHVEQSAALAFLVRVFLTPVVWLLAYPLPFAGTLLLCCTLLWLRGYRIRPGRGD